MKKRLLLFTLFLFSISQTEAQVKFGAKSGVGVFFDFSDYSVLAPSFDEAPKVSLYDNLIPGSHHTIYTRLSQQHEIFATYHNNIFKLAVAFASPDRPYNDPLELFWKYKMSIKYVHYQLGYGLTVFDKKLYRMDIQSGIIVEKYHVVLTRYDVVESNGKYFAVNPSIETPGKGANQFDWGFPLEINADYKLGERAAIGLQAKTSYILGLGIQWLYLMPMIKVQF